VETIDEQNSTAHPAAFVIIPIGPLCLRIKP
jgi:hypothetical protein